MTAGRSDRRPVRIRRRGRHTSPSQVEKVAQQAGKAAPAVAIAGALVAAPQASHALADSAKPVTVTAQSHTRAAASTDAATSARATAATLDSFATRTVAITAAKPARHTTVAKNSYYQVRSGDSLSKIADQYYQNADDWQYLYHENDTTLSDPNLIYPGQRLLIPATVPAQYSLSDYVPRHAKPVQPVTQTVFLDVQQQQFGGKQRGQQPEQRRVVRQHRRCRRRRHRGRPVGPGGHVQLLGP